MAHADKLAEALEALHVLQQSGAVAIRSKDLSRLHRERLLRNGFLQPVLRGWYIPRRPDETQGESTAWYASFWKFCAAYLAHRFGQKWCLSAEQSLFLHAGNWTVPRQLLVRAPKNARNNVTTFLHGTSLLDVRAVVPTADDADEIEGLRVYSLPTALIGCAPGEFRRNPIDLRTALSRITDASAILERLLGGGHSTVAGRLAGAFRNIGRDRIAQDILGTMRAAGYTINEKDPFESELPVAFS